MLERVLFGGRGKNSAARADDVDDSVGDRAPPLAALRGAGDCAPPMECAGQRLKVQPEHAGAAGRKQAHRPAARWQIPLGVARGELVLVSQRGLGRGAELGRGPAAARLFGLFSASGVSADARRLGLTVRVREALFVCARGGTARENSSFQLGNQTDTVLERHRRRHTDTAQILGSSLQHLLGWRDLRRPLGVFAGAPVKRRFKLDSAQCHSWAPCPLSRTASAQRQRWPRRRMRRATPCSSSSRPTGNRQP